MKLPSKLVGIENRAFQSVIRGAAHMPIVLKRNDWVRLTHVAYSGEDAHLSFEALERGRGVVTLYIDGEPYEIPVAIFRDREFFVCLTISSNYHVGIGPRSLCDRCAGGWAYARGTWL